MLIETPAEELVEAIRYARLSCSKHALNDLICSSVPTVILLLNGSHCCVSRTADSLTLLQRSTHVLYKFCKVPLQRSCCDSVTLIFAFLIIITPRWCHAAPVGTRKAIGMGCHSSRYLCRFTSRRHGDHGWGGSWQSGKHQGNQIQATGQQPCLRSSCYWDSGDVEPPIAVELMQELGRRITAVTDDVNSCFSGCEWLCNGEMRSPSAALSPPNKRRYGHFAYTTISSAYWLFAGGLKNKIIIIIIFIWWMILSSFGSLMKKVFTLAALKDSPKDQLHAHAAIEQRRKTS